MQRLKTKMQRVKSTLEIFFEHFLKMTKLQRVMTKTQRDYNAKTKFKKSRSGNDFLEESLGGKI